MPDAWVFVAIINKWVLYVSHLGASGTVFCALIFQLDRTRLLAFAFACVGLISGVTVFLLKGAALTGNASGMADLEILGLLWNTQSGTALIYQIAGLGLLLGGLLLGNFGKALSMFGGLIALWSFGVAGHISDRDNFLLLLVLLAHLAGAAIWIGILVPLRRLASDPLQIVEAAALGVAFGRVAMFAVPCLIIAGVIMTYTIVGSLDAMISTDYGQALLMKILLIAGMLALSATNKVRFVPGIVRGDTVAAVNLSRCITVEWVVVALILALTAVFTSTLTLPN